MQGTDTKYKRASRLKLRIGVSTTLAGGLLASWFSDPATITDNKTSKINDTIPAKPEQLSIRHLHLNNLSLPEITRQFHSIGNLFINDAQAKGGGGTIGTFPTGNCTCTEVLEGCPSGSGGIVHTSCAPNDGAPENTTCPSDTLSGECITHCVTNPPQNSACPDGEAGMIISITYTPEGNAQCPPPIVLNGCIEVPPTPTTQCTTPGLINVNGSCVCPGNQVNQFGSCQCPSGMTADTSGHCSCAQGATNNGGTTSCTCPAGEHLAPNLGMCVNGDCPEGTIRNTDGSCFCTNGGTFNPMLSSCSDTSTTTADTTTATTVATTIETGTTCGENEVCNPCGEDPAFGNGEGEGEPCDTSLDTSESTNNDTSDTTGDTSSDTSSDTTNNTSSDSSSDTTACADGAGECQPECIGVIDGSGECEPDCDGEMGDGWGYGEDDCTESSGDNSTTGDQNCDPPNQIGLANLGEQASIGNARSQCWIGCLDPNGHMAFGSNGKLIPGAQPTDCPEDTSGSCPPGQNLDEDGECCPEGQHGSPDHDGSCVPDDTSSGCPSDRILPDNTCCDEGSHADPNGICCPNGQHANPNNECLPDDCEPPNQMGLVNLGEQTSIGNARSQCWIGCLDPNGQMAFDSNGKLIPGAQPTDCPEDTSGSCPPGQNLDEDGECCPEGQHGSPDHDGSCVPDDCPPDRYIDEENCCDEGFHADLDGICCLDGEHANPSLDGTCLPDDRTEACPPGEHHEGNTCCNDGSHLDTDGECCPEGQHASPDHDGSCVDNSYDSYYDDYYCDYDSYYDAISLQPTLPEIPKQAALPRDNRYRDLCLRGADLPATEFDKQNGALVNTQEVPIEPYDSYGYYDYDHGHNYDTSSYSNYDDGVPEGLSPHAQKYVGTVSGSKPPSGVCMPMKDTPIIDTSVIDLNNPTATGNNLFSYYMSLDNSLFANVYTQSSAGNPNNYRDLTFFLGGVTGCPADLTLDWPEGDNDHELKRKNTARYGDLLQKRAEYCYDYYILNHSKSPWYILEKPGVSTDDPLTRVDSDRTYLNTCQPMIRGDEAANVTKCKGNEKQFGFAPVLRYDRPDMDEAEYLLSGVLQQRWDERFNEDSWNSYKVKTKQEYDPAGNATTFTLPCLDGLETSSVAFPNAVPTTFTSSSSQSTPNNVPQAFITQTVAELQPLGAGSSSKCGYEQHHNCIEWQYTIIGTPWYQYQTAPHDGPYYCPNVEKITDPAGPFAPRDAIVSSLTPLNAPYTSDRDWSSDTKTQVPYPQPPLEPSCQPTETRTGYTGMPYEIINDPITNTKDVQVPYVMCGVVPVDVLSMRDPNFANCMSERIHYNYSQWIKARMPDQKDGKNTHRNMTNSQGKPKDTDGSSWMRCATRYWETDAPDCQASMSIQQCCSIINKDLTPTNFLKMRTHESLEKKVKDDKGKILKDCSKAKNYDGYDEDYGVEDYDNDDYDDYSYEDAYTRQAREAAAKKCENDNFISDGGEKKYHKIAPMTKEDGYREDQFPGKQNAYAYFRAACVAKKLSDIAGGATEPADYQFQTYFRSTSPQPWVDTLHIAHMPYMRWWDTGVSAGNLFHGGDYVNTLGAYTTILGVGREERNSYDAQKGSMGTHPEEIGRIGGWMELKAHQLYTARNNNMSCIGRYERLFKWRGPENYALAKAGAAYASRTGAQWPWPLGWRGYASASNSKGFPLELGGNSSAVGTGLDNALPGDIITYKMNGLNQVYYVTDIGFPIVKNRQEAYYDFKIGKFRLGSASGKILIPDHIFVISWDQGKFPSPVGVSTSAGMGMERTIYKEAVPENYRKTICNKEMSALTAGTQNITSGKSADYCSKSTSIGDGQSQQEHQADPSGHRDHFTKQNCLDYKCQPSCEDSDYSACVLPSTIAQSNTNLGWDQAKIYRPNADVRKCTGTITGAPTPANGDPALSLQKTYDWTASVKAMVAPDKSVIYQGMTQQIDTSMWAKCVNDGYDPPSHFAREYKGPGTGAITDNTLCGPGWGDCVLSGGTQKYYPKGFRKYK